jgi:hypothetical protein
VSYCLSEREDALSVCYGCRVATTTMQLCVLDENCFQEHHIRAECAIAVANSLLSQSCFRSCMLAMNLLRLRRLAAYVHGGMLHEPLHHLHVPSCAVFSFPRSSTTCLRVCAALHAGGGRVTLLLALLSC